MPRGGSRSGRPGEAYSNRTDLNASPRLAPKANVGQPYGTAKAQEDAQTTLPMGPPPVSLSAPTQHPSEPVTNGLSIGPGIGPEAIPSLAPESSADPDIANFAPYIGTLELLSSLPNASTASRNLIRRLRSAIPPSQPTTQTPEPRVNP